MNYHIDEYKRLVITVDAEERAELQEMKDENDADKPFISDAAMYDFLEPLTCNSDLDWISPDETGDMTSAPMLGIRDYQDENCIEESKIISRWAFMDYQVVSVLEVLLHDGEAIFVGGDE